MFELLGERAKFAQSELASRDEPGGLDWDDGYLRCAACGDDVAWIGESGFFTTCKSCLTAMAREAAVWSLATFDTDANDCEEATAS